MFICDSCKEVTGPKVSPRRVVLQTREKEYPFRKDAFKRKKDGAWTKEDDQGGIGTEAVKEACMCDACASTVSLGA